MNQCVELIVFFHVLISCIVGGGIIGLNIARELRRRFGRGLRIAILEKV